MTGFFIGIGQDDDIFITAIAYYDIAVPDHVFDALANDAQSLAADKMAEIVVDQLEEIDVEKDQRDRTPLTLTIHHEIVEKLIAVAAVV
jgi:hypothetical protein